MHLTNSTQLLQHPWILQGEHRSAQDAKELKLTLKDLLQMANENNKPGVGG